MLIASILRHRLISLTCCLSLASGVMAQDAAAPAEPAAPPAPTIAVTTPPAEITLRLLPMTTAELAKEADAWVGTIRALTVEIVDRKVAIVGAQGNTAELKRLNAELARLTEARRKVFAGFDLLLASWEAKGGNADAIAAHRKFLSALRADEIKATDKGTLLTAATEWMFAKDGGVRVMWRTVIFIGSLFLVWLIAGLVSRLVHRAVRRWDKFSTLLDRFLVRAAFWATMLIGTLTALAWLGLRLTPILTLLGGASFVLAFAMQSTLSNFAAGLMIMIYRPFDVGNVVTVGGVTGKVETMNLVSTTLRTGDNQLIIVPNSNVWGSIITNANVSETRRVDLEFGIDYDDDAAAAKKILEEVVASHPLVLKEPAPIVRMSGLTEKSVRFICRPWAKTADYSTVEWDITQQVKERFTAAGIYDAPKGA